MKIGLVSDTHGCCDGLAESIKGQGAEYILHMGDGVEEAYILKAQTGLPTLVVAGNNDLASKEKAELFLVLDQIPIWMTHGHRYGVYYSREGLWEVAIQKEAKIVLYGHTHVFRDEMIGGIRFINPGSPTLPRGGGLPSYAILDLASGELRQIILPPQKKITYFF